MYRYSDCIHEVFINSSVVQQQLVANKINFKLCHKIKSGVFLILLFFLIPTPSRRAIFSEHEQTIYRSLRSVNEKIIEVRTRHLRNSGMNVSAVAVHLQGSDSELAKLISIFLFRDFVRMLRFLNLEGRLQRLRLRMQS